MTLFRNNTHRDIWKMRWCHTCYEQQEAARRIQHKETVCPIWEKALRTDRKPIEWDRNTRTDEMERSIKCNAYQPRPASRYVHQDKQFEDVPMFDVEPAEPRFIPVENWPDRPKADGVDHA